MKVCPICGEVYTDRARRCRAHDGPLGDWAAAPETDPGLTTDVEGRRIETPFELHVVAGEIARADDAARWRQVQPLDATPAVVIADGGARGRTPSGGRVLGGRYRLGKQLGVGGYGAVFAGVDELTGDRVAIKVLSPAAAQSSEMITRFHREAIAASRVRHRYIVDVTDFDVDVDGTQFIVMEYLDGCDLAATLDAAGALAPARALAIAARCARGLDAVHRVGILHRDLKPANVFLVGSETGADAIKIIDFGISKLTRAAGDYTDLTSASKVVGTPCYMSPEQARGLELDARSDVYGLGIMLFEMLVGERPFTGRAPIEILAKHIDAPRVPPSTRRAALAACPGLDALVLTAIAVEPERRYRSMAAFADAIIACLGAIDPGAAERVAEPTGEVTAPTGAAPPRPLPEAAAREGDVDTETRLRRAVPPRRTAGPWLGAVAAALALAVVGWRVTAGGAPAPAPTTAARPLAPAPIAPAPRPIAPAPIAPAPIAPAPIAPAPIAPAPIAAAPIVPAPIAVPPPAPPPIAAPAAAPPRPPRRVGDRAPARAPSPPKPVRRPPAELGVQEW